MFNTKILQLFYFSILLIVTNISWAKNDDIVKIVEKELGVDLAIQFSSPISQTPKSFVKHSPYQLVIDFFGITNHLPNLVKQINRHGLVSFQISSQDDRLRLVVTGKNNFNHKIIVNDDQLLITLNPVVKKEQQLTESTQQYLDNIKISTTGLDGQAIIKLGFSTSALDVKLDRENEKQLSLIVQDMKVSPKLLAQKIDTAQSKILKDIVFKQEANKTLVTMIALNDFSHMSHQVGKDFIITMSDKDIKTQKIGSLSPAKTKEHISLNFQKIAIRSVLQLLAEFAQMNVVISDTVQGNISLKLDKVPWEQAMDIVLRTKDLARRRMGNVILIAPTAEIVAQETRELRSQKQAEELIPLHSEIIQVNYAISREIATILKDKNISVLSDRGTVTTDNRTNILLIKDSKDKIREIKKLVRKLDIPVKQVVIETRIVDVDEQFERDLGVNFGISAPKSHLSGTLDGASTNVNNTSITAVPYQKRLNIHLPGKTTTGHAGIGLALAKLGGNVLLDLELKALESERKGTIISTPHIVTMDRHSAMIESGDEIPYNETTSSGAASIAFKKAVLKLEVTPHITPNRKIVLGLKINNDQPIKLADNDPYSIRTKALQTQILVNNGETIVLGGVLVKNEQNTAVRVPLLSKIPVLGNLFSSKHKETAQRRLLIFITPKILDAKTKKIRLKNYNVT